MDFQDFNDDEELKALEKASSDQKNMKGYLGALGAVADNFQSIPGSHELLWGGNGRAPTASKALGAVTAQMEDPLERKQKSFEYLKSKRAEKAALDADSPASPEMISFYEGVVPSMKGKFSGMTAAQLEKVSPVLMAKFRAEGDERMARMQAGQRAAERADEREFKKELIDSKKKELGATQAKKKNLFDIGVKAENQFDAAVEKGKTGGYDPTSSVEFIDNSSWAPNWMKSDAAVEARASQDSWIDSFLRDESGAAIPETERGSYRKVYFPVPGDTAQAVANKAALRKQKMAGAAEIAGVDPGNQPAVQIAKPTLSPKDQKAVEWALSNPSDPRAAQILKLHGVDSETAVGSR